MQKKIPENLIGSNPVFESGIYQDDYLRNMNEIYPINVITGGLGVKKTDERVRLFKHFMTDSPVHCGAVEHDILWPLFGYSVKEGIWKPRQLEGSTIMEERNMSPEDFLELVEKSTSEMLEDYPTSMHKAIASGLIIPTIYKNDILSIPTEQWGQYLWSKKL